MNLLVRSFMQSGINILQRKKEKEHMTKEITLEEIDVLIANKQQALSEAIAPYDKKRIQEKIDVLESFKLAHAELSRIIGGSQFFKLLENDDEYTIQIGNNLQADFSKYGTFEGKYSFHVIFDSGVHSNVRTKVRRELSDKQPNQITIGKATSKKILAWLDYASALKEQAKKEQESIDQIHSEFLAKVSQIPGVVSMMYDDSLKAGYVQTPNKEFQFEWRISDGNPCIEQKLTVYNSTYGAEALNLFLKLFNGGF